MAFLKHFLISLALVAYSQAHMIMINPVPIGHPSNSPLDNTVRNPAANSDALYPCHISSVTDYQDAQVTTLEAGSSLNVAFRGSAVHGGGSCQFSLSKDISPTVDSIFKVIHSVEGGCPARNVSGNFPSADANFADPSTYPVTIPQGLESGRYTFSWTWVNKVGNREFYMNCAALQIGPTANVNKNSSDTARKRATNAVFESLPDMVILNTSDDDCKDVDESLGVSFKYADPGRSVEINEEIDDKFMVLPQCKAGGGKYITAGSSADSSVVETPSTDSQTNTALNTASTAAIGRTTEDITKTVIPSSQGAVVTAPTSIGTTPLASSTPSFSNYHSYRHSSYNPSWIQVTANNRLAGKTTVKIIMAKNLEHAATDFASSVTTAGISSDPTSTRALTATGSNTLVMTSTITSIPTSENTTAIPPEPVNTAPNKRYFSSTSSNDPPTEHVGNVCTGERFNETTQRDVTAYDDGVQVKRCGGCLCSKMDIGTSIREVENDAVSSVMYGVDARRHVRDFAA